MRLPLSISLSEHTVRLNCDKLRIAACNFCTNSMETGVWNLPPLGHICSPVCSSQRFKRPYAQSVETSSPPYQPTSQPTTALRQLSKFSLFPQVRIMNFTSRLGLFVLLTSLTSAALGAVIDSRAKHSSKETCMIGGCYMDPTAAGCGNSMLGGGECDAYYCMAC
ncbi:hypothetical protein F5880DRAFT_1008131 [Lentinula raphanica]|nr:hypothetical protein F5880DRAFT_1008131 [Lentinula raphanica]